MNISVVLMIIKNLLYFKKKFFYIALKNDYPDDNEIERTKEFIERILNFKNGEELTQLTLKNDVILLADIFGTFFEVSFKEFGTYPLYCVSLPVFTLQSSMKYSGTEVETLHDREMILTLEKIIRGRISSLFG